MRRRGPYKKFLHPTIIPPHTKRRRDEAQRRLQLIGENNGAAEQPANAPHVINEAETRDFDGVVENEQPMILAEPPVPMPQVNNVEKPSTGDNDAAAGEATLQFGEYDVNDDESKTNTEDTNLNNETDEAVRHSFKYLLEYLNVHYKIRDFTVHFNVGEILLMVLTLSLIHNMTLSCICDIIKLLNVLCCTSVFPSTPYLFKKYLNPARKLMVHYVCERCGDYLGAKNDANVEDHVNINSMTCTNCEKINIFKGYRYDYSFITLDIGSQVNDILKDPKYNLTFFDDAYPDINIYSDITSGSMYRRKVPFSCPSNTRYISCTFNIDASPISKDGKTSITPIFLMINELDYNVRGENLILAGLWYGKEKPRMDIFLYQFTNQMNQLGENGIPVNYKNEKILLKIIPLCCCFDTVTRAQVQGIKAVNGYYCCSWCQIEGKNIIDTQIKYPNEDPEPDVRTEVKFFKSNERFADEETDIDTLKGINAVSPLLEMKFFSMIWGFCPDIMHLRFLGINF